MLLITTSNLSVAPYCVTASHTSAEGGVHTSYRNTSGVMGRQAQSPGLPPPALLLRSWVFQASVSATLNLHCVTRAQCLASDLMLLQGFDDPVAYLSYNSEYNARYMVSIK